MLMDNGYTEVAGAIVEERSHIRWGILEIRIGIKYSICHDMIFSRLPISKNPLPEVVKMAGKRVGIIDVGSKRVVFREAEATGILKLSKKSLNIVSKGKSIKGDVREASTVAAIQAVKETPRTIPHCHTVPVEGCSVQWEIEPTGLRCTVTVSTHWTTGVEMEALCGVSAGLLCAFDMLKSTEKDTNGQYHDTCIEGIRVSHKKKEQPHI